MDANKIVSVHTLWHDGTVELVAMTLADAVVYVSRWGGEAKAITIY